MFMDKKLKAHYQYIENKTKLLEASPDAKLLDSTIAYHQNMVKNFQHERLIHLIVTFFFVPVTLVLLFLDIAIILGDYDQTLTAPIACLSAVVAILAVTDAFYVRHYYRLENGVEKLYGLTKKLYKLKGV